MTFAANYTSLIQQTKAATRKQNYACSCCVSTCTSSDSRIRIFLIQRFRLLSNFVWIQYHSMHSIPQANARRVRLEGSLNLPTRSTYMPYLAQVPIFIVKECIHRSVDKLTNLGIFSFIHESHARTTPENITSRRLFLKVGIQ